MESWCISALEALAMGKKVIGDPNVIPFLTPQNNATPKSRRAFASKFTWDRQALKQYEVYREVVDD
jgi:hypothetical protein